MTDTPQKRSLLGRLLALAAKIIIPLVAIVAIIWIFFLNPIVAHQIKSRTGFGVTIQRLHVNPFTGTAEIDGLHLTNPPGEFRTPGFVDLNALHATIALRTLLFGDQVVIESAALDLPAVTLVRRDAGPSNAVLFAQRLQGDPATATPPQPAPQPAPKPGAPAKPLNYLVKKLDINIGQLLITNEPASGEPTNYGYNINYKHTYENITDPKQLLTLDLAKTLLAVGSQLTDLLPANLGAGTNNVLQNTLNTLNNPAATSVQGAVQGLLDKLKK
jgi:hypothetical protein